MGTDRDAEFDQFALGSWPRLRWAAYLLTGDHHLAEDLAQTTLERTYAAWRRVRSGDAHAYARRVLVDLNVDRLRRRRLTEHSTDRLPENASQPVTMLEDRDEVIRLLAGLTERERRVVVLRHLYDLPEAAVAAELGIALGTVKSTHARALGKLRAVVEHPENQTDHQGAS